VFYVEVAKVDRDVANVSHMFQKFYLDVAYVLQ
jgi:hypothetical protein